MDARFALLLGCFALSGFAALLYQTVWSRQISFVFGTSDLAVAAVLAAYMGGLAVGSAAAARLAPRLRRPVLVYGLLELGIAVSALLIPAGIRFVDHLYVALLGGQSELPEAVAGMTALQLASSFALLLPPTAMMGATLPLLARHAVHSDQELASRVGVLYAVNTAGAIAGALVAAFWLIPEFGLRRTVWVGAVQNAAVFLLAARLARSAAPPPDPRARTRERKDEGPGAAWILPAIALSGAVSFAYEVLWTRLLGHVVGGSLQAFATMLASFLLGIALGSAAVARCEVTRERARIGFAIAQLGIAATSYLAFVLADQLPALARALGAGFDAPLPSAGFAAAALLPITVCIGATFPLAVRILTERPEHAARATARVYAWNTVGAIAGALGAGFVLLPGCGFEGTLALGVAASLSLAAIGALASPPRRRILAGSAGALAVLLALAPPATPWSLLRYGPLGAGRVRGGKIAFSAVGRSSTVIVTDRRLHWRLFTNGLPEAVIERAGVLPFPSSIAYWLGFLPTLVRPEVREMLVVGLGGGSALEAVPSTVARIDVIELEPEVIAGNRAVAAERARDPLADPRIRVHIGDARGSLRLATQRYGAIVSQPSHPWTAGASHLYTREFFSLVRSRLEPDGVFVQWMGLEYVDEALLRALASALVEVFGHVEIYAPTERGVLFAASAEPLAGFAGVDRALRSAPADYARFGIESVEDVASCWLLDEEGVRTLARGIEAITDDDNPLATRASRLGDRTLGRAAARALFAPHDPLIAAHGELDEDALMRALAQRENRRRARYLAESAEGAARERSLGWLELSAQRVRSAARHFARARSLAPQDREALVGLVLSRREELARGPSAEIAESELDAAIAAVVAGWRDLEHGGAAAIASRDPMLARFAPADALFREASRQRALWRLEVGGRAASAEAAAILERVLLRDWHAEDAELHARAVAAAGEHTFAWGSLERILALADSDRPGREQARRALEIAKGLPGTLAESLRVRLARRADGGASTGQSPPIRALPDRRGRS